MSSRRTRRPAASAKSISPPTADANLVWTGGTGLGGFGTGGGHQGADYSRLRGLVYFPELDTRREIAPWTRIEILRRSRFLYANYGIAKRIINGLSRMIAGTGLTYQAATSDREWNRLAEQAYNRVTRSRHLYDLGGRYNGANSQQATLRFRFRDGDCAQVLTSDPLTGTARFAFYEAHQIGNIQLPSELVANTGWRDGVLHGKFNEALAYRILTDGGEYTDVPASSLLFQCDHERAGQSRGLSALSHAINHLLDAAEITSYIKTGVKLSNRHGYWIETQPGSAAPLTAAQRASGGVTTPNAGPIQTVQTSAGPINLERVIGGGEMPALGPGQSIKFNSSSNPHPNQLGLLDYLIRDVAQGVPFGGVSPELLWNITTLGGANTRFVLADAQQFVEVGQQALVDDKLQPEAEFILACEIQAGRLRPCKDPQWWKALWIPPARITVDFGRDGKLHLEQIKSGALTFREMHGWRGKDSDTERATWLDEWQAWGDDARARGCTDAEVEQIRAAIYGRPGMAPAANGDTPPAPGEANPDTATETATDMAARFAELCKRPGAGEALLRQLAALPED